MKHFNIMGIDVRLILIVGIFSSSTFGQVSILKSAVLSTAKVLNEFEKVNNEETKSEGSVRDCICTPIDKCKSHVPSEDGTGLINKRVPLELCAGYLDVCCYDSPESLTEKYETSSTEHYNEMHSSTTHNSHEEIPSENIEDECICTPFNLCKSYVPATDGHELIDIRINLGPCRSYMDVCCNDTKISSTINYESESLEKTSECGCNKDINNESHFGDTPIDSTTDYNGSHSSEKGHGTTQYPETHSGHHIGSTTEHSSEKYHSTTEYGGTHHGDKDHSTTEHDETYHGDKGHSSTKYPETHSGHHIGSTTEHSGEKYHSTTEYGGTHHVDKDHSTTEHGGTYHGDKYHSTTEYDETYHGDKGHSSTKYPETHSGHHIGSTTEHSGEKYHSTTEYGGTYHGDKYHSTTERGETYHGDKDHNTTEHGESYHGHYVGSKPEHNGTHYGNMDHNTEHSDTHHKCGVWNPNGLHIKVINAIDGESQYSEYPSMVAIFLEEESKHGDKHLKYHCGGSLIKKNVVLTATHCLHGKDQSTLVIRAGEWDLKSEKEIFPHQDRRVSKIVSHPNYYAGLLENDVSLIFTDKPFYLQENIQTICLPDEKDNYEYERCFSSGWGKTVSHFNTYIINKKTHSGTNISDKQETALYPVSILKKVEVPVVPRDKCIKALRTTRLGPIFKLHESFICAGGEEGKDTCRGDGGSPLMCPSKHDNHSLVQVGIVAWGINCGLADIPAVYVDVAYFKNWIIKEIEHYSKY